MAGAFLLDASGSPKFSTLPETAGFFELMKNVLLVISLRSLHKPRMKRFHNIKHAFYISINKSHLASSKLASLTGVFFFNSDLDCIFNSIICLDLSIKFECNFYILNILYQFSSNWFSLHILGLYLLLLIDFGWYLK